MPVPASKASELYKKLIEDGYTAENIGSEQEFTQKASTKEGASKLHSVLLSEGYTVDNLGDVNEFTTKLVSASPDKKKVSTTEQPASSEGLQDGGLKSTTSTTEQPATEPVYENIIGLSLQKKKLYKEATDESTPSVSGSTGGAAVSFKPNQQKLDQANEINTKLVKDFSLDDKAINSIDKEIEDLPGEDVRSKWKNPDGAQNLMFTNDALSRLREQDYNKYIQTLNTAKVYGALYNADKELGREYAKLNAEAKALMTDDKLNNANVLKNIQDRTLEIISKNDKLNEYQKEKIINYENEIYSSMANELMPDESSVKDYLSKRLSTTLAELDVPPTAANLYSGKKVYDGDDVDNYPIESIEKKLDRNNPFDAVALQKYKSNRSYVEAIKNSPNIEEAAINYVSGIDPTIAQQRLLLNNDGRELPQVQIAEYVNSFLEDERTKQLAETNPEFRALYLQAKNGFDIKYPKYAEKRIAEIISQAREDRGMNNILINIPTEASTRQLVDDLVKEGKLTEANKELYYQKIDPKVGVGQSIMRGTLGLPFGAFTGKSPISTPGVAENALQSFQETTKAMGRTIQDFNLLSPIQISNAYRLESSLTDNYSTLKMNLTKAHEISEGTGHLVGFTIPMVFGAGALRAAGASEKAAHLINNALMFEGQNKDRALQLFPNDPSKRVTFTAISTAGDVLLTEIIPTKAIRDKISKIIKKDVVEITNKLVTGQITAQAAGESLINKTISSLPEFAVKNAQTAGVITGFGVYHKALESLFGASDIGAAEIAYDAVKEFKHNYLLTPILTLAGMKGVSASSKLESKLLMEMAASPDVTKQRILDYAEKNNEPAEVTQEKLRNLDNAARVFNDLGSTKLTEAQKEKYIVLSTAEKALMDKSLTIEDGDIREGYIKEAEKYKKQKEKILKNKDKATEYDTYEAEEKEEVSTPVPTEVIPEIKATADSLKDIISKGGEDAAQAQSKLDLLQKDPVAFFEKEKANYLNSVKSLETETSKSAIDSTIKYYNELITKIKLYDTKNIEGLPGEVGVGEKPIEAKPVEVGSSQETGGGGVLQENVPSREGKVAEVPQGEVEAQIADIELPKTEDVDSKVKRLDELSALGNKRYSINAEEIESLKNEIGDATMQKYLSDGWNDDAYAKAEIDKFNVLFSEQAKKQVEGKNAIIPQIISVKRSEKRTTKSGIEIGDNKDWEIKFNTGGNYAMDYNKSMGNPYTAMMQAWLNEFHGKNESIKYRESVEGRDNLTYEQLKNYKPLKSLKELPKTETVPVLGVEQETTIKEMKPFTDRMVEIEREFKNNGYEIDTDYDNEIQILDRNGEQVEPAELPKSLSSLAADYERATSKLGEFDASAREKALAESRKVVEAEAEVIEPKKEELPAPEKKQLKDGDSVPFKDFRQNNLTGEKVEIPGYESMDLILVKDGFDNKIYELSTGMELADVSAFSKEEAISEASKSLLEKKLTAEGIYSKIRKAEEDKTSSRLKIMNESPAYESYKAQKKAEYEKKPFIQSESDRAEMNKMADDIESIDKNVAETLRYNANKRVVEGDKSWSFSMSDAKRMVDFAKEKAEINRLKSENLPLPEGKRKERSTSVESLKESINEGYTKDRFEGIPDDLKEPIIEAWRKQNEIYNKYGYNPKSLQDGEGVTLVVGKYLAALNSRDLAKRESRIENELNNMKREISKLDKVHAEEFPAPEPIIKLEKPTINKDNKGQEPFVTRNKKQMVKINQNGTAMVTDMQGNPVSRAVEKKALREYAKKFDYSVGTKAEESGNKIYSTRDMIIESENPLEIAEIYANEELTTANLSATEAMIYDYGIGKVTNNSFRRYNDVNNITMSLAKSYLNNREGRGLDQIAKDMSDHYFPEGNGTEISPEDVADFMVRFPSGTREAGKLMETDIAREAAEKFKQLTGLYLNREIADIAINQQFELLNKEQQKLLEYEYKNQSELEKDYWDTYAKTDGFTKEIPVGEAKQAKAAPRKKVGNFEAKAQKIADKIMAAELPSWLSISDKDVTTKGVDAESVKRMLADAVVNMGKLLDSGVEFSEALKQSVKELVGIKGEENRASIEKGFEEYYKAQVPLEENPFENIPRTQAARDKYFDTKFGEDADRAREIYNQGGTAEEMLAKMETPIVDKGKLEGDIKGITMEDNAQRREAIGMEERKPNPESVEQWRAEAQKRIADGYNINKLIEKMEKGEPTDKVENEISRIFAATLDEAVKNNPTNENINAYRRLIEARENSSREIGRSLRSLQGVSNPLENISDFYVAEMESLNVNELTETQKKNIQQQFDTIQASKEEYRKKYEEAQDKFAEMQAQNELLKQKRESKAKPTKEGKDYVAERQSLKEKLRQAIEKYKNNANKMGIASDGGAENFAITVEMAKIISQIAKSHVEEVGAKLVDVTRRTLDDVKDLFDGITEKDIRDIIAGKYSERKETKSELAANLRQLKAEAALLNELDRVIAGEPKTEKARIEKNQRLAEIRKQINEVKKNNGLEEYSEETKAKKAIEANKKKQKEIEERIANNDFDAPEKRESIYESSEFKRNNPSLYNELLDSQTKMHEAELEFHKKLVENEMANMSKMDKFKLVMKKAGGTLRAFFAGIDDSAVGVQNWFRAVRNPVIGTRAIRDHVLDFWSQKRFDRTLAELYNSPDYKAMKESGLQISNPKSLLEEGKEELFPTRFRAIIKLNGKEYGWVNIGGKKYELFDVLKPFERAFTSLGNSLRVISFRTAAAKLESKGITFEKNPEEYKKLATRINAQTSASQPNKAFQSEILNLAVWSPRLMSSKLNILGVSDLASFTPLVKQGYYRSLGQKGKILSRQQLYAAYDMAQFAASIVAGSYLYASARGGTVNTNPFDDRFMDVELPNGKSYNFTGGFSKYIATLFQITSGGKVERKTGLYKEYSGFKDRGSEVLHFMRGKMPPISGSVVNLAVGKDYTGNETSLSSEAEKYKMPMAIAQISKQLENDGYSSLFGDGIPTFLGISVKDKRDYKSPKSLFDPNVDLQLPEFKTLIEKGIEIPELGNREKYKVDKTVKHPDEVMTPEEFDIFKDLVGKYMKEGYTEPDTDTKVGGIKEILNTSYVVEMYNKEDEIEKEEYVLGKNLTKEQLESKINELKSKAIKKAKEEMMLVEKKPRIVVKKEE